jgi:hypothetical protein
MNIQTLTTQIQALAPIYGVSIGVAGDVSTVKVNYQPAATSDQQAQVNTFLQTVTLDTAATAALKQGYVQQLQDTDLKILRNMEELALGQTPYLDASAMLALYNQRQVLRKAITS